MDNQILAALKRAAPKDLPKAVYRQFPITRAHKILVLVREGLSLEAAIEKTAKKGKQ